MKLSRESQCALRAMAYLAQRPRGEVREASGIAEAEGIPPSFAAKILLQRAFFMPVAAGPFLP